MTLSGAAGGRTHRVVSAPHREPELIALARSGDEGAFAELVVMHADRVYGALRRFGLPAGEAEKVAQDVFLRAWRGLAGFHERARFSTWVHRIAFNEARRRLAPRGPVSVVFYLDGDLGPEAQAGEHEFEVALQSALLHLPVEWRAAVLLRDVEGLSTEEASAVLGVGRAAFKRRLHRGRMQLRAQLEPYLAVG